MKDIISHKKENNAESQENYNANVERFSNQCRTVYNLLKQGVKLTVRDAMIKHNIGDLRRRIKDLKDNFKIEIKSRYAEKDGKREPYKEWFI